MTLQTILIIGVYCLGLGIAYKSGSKIGKLNGKEEGFVDGKSYGLSAGERIGIKKGEENEQKRLSKKIETLEKTIESQDSDIECLDKTVDNKSMEISELEKEKTLLEKQHGKIDWEGWMKKVPQMYPNSRNSQKTMERSIRKLARFFGYNGFNQ